LIEGSAHVAAPAVVLSQLSAHVAGLAHCTRQCPPGQSTSHDPVQTTSHDAAPSHRTWLPSPTDAEQRPRTYWQATRLPRPQVARQSNAFWQETLQSSPPVMEHAWLWLAQ
jgi:hypothetical protein